MNAVEFATELTAAPTLVTPADIVARLPKSSRTRILLLANNDDNDSPADLDAAYAQVPEDVSLQAVMLPLVDAGDRE